MALVSSGHFSLSFLLPPFHALVTVWSTAAVDYTLMGPTGECLGLGLVRKTQVCMPERRSCKLPSPSPYSNWRHLPPLA